MRIHLGRGREDAPRDRPGYVIGGLMRALAVALRGDVMAWLKRYHGDVLKE